MGNSHKTYNYWVKAWLFTGLVMLIIQILVGGITRLTESGLSITKWEVIQGTIPPLSKEEWREEFDLYKTTPQYLEINEGMSLSDFKFIYFWEWVHRFWARIMGFVFIIPFLIFALKGWFDRYLYGRLLGVFLLALLAATFGWIMVASGLIQRPWVNAYKLSLHLCIALSVYAYLLWTWFHTFGYQNKKIEIRGLGTFMIILWIQLFLGGMMSGMKAAVVYPEWPYMNGSFIPSIIFDASQWSMNNFNNYDQNIFMPALVQTFHRLIAYSLFIFGSLIIVKTYKEFSSTRYVFITYFFGAALFGQILLGILTLLYSQGEVPVSLGVCHQFGAVFLLSISYYLYFLNKSKN